MKSMKSCEIFEILKSIQYFGQGVTPCGFCVMVYHLLEVVFISVGGSVSMCFTITTPTVDYSFVGPGRVEGIYWDT